MFIELHILQNFAPSNLNRDDTNNPKDCEFGGVRRARISSQCIKRSIRRHPDFTDATQVEPAKRTRWVTRLLTQRLVEAGKAENDAKAVADAMAQQYSKLDKKGNTVVLLYLSDGELRSLTEKVLQSWETVQAEATQDKKPTLEELMKAVVKETKDRTSAPDIALFGRMLAEKPDLNLDAACQVAHAISTHRVVMDIDFYTAVDDLQSDEETGAGMMGVTGFNSACFYRYAAIDWGQLVKNLAGDVELARRTVEGFLRAAVLAVPTGKQNSFAAQNPPSLVLAVTNKGRQPWSLANAFEVPVRSGRDGGLVAESVAALDRYWGHLTRMYGSKGLMPVALAEDGNLLQNLAGAQVDSLDRWVADILAQLPQG